MAKMSITERAQALPCTHKIICMHARTHAREVTSKIRPVLLPHIRFNRDMMLANHNTPRTATRSTHVILVTNKCRTLQWPAQSMDFNPSKHVWAQYIEAQCTCTAAATKSQGAHAYYSSDVPLYNSFFTDSLYHGEQCTLL